MKTLDTNKAAAALDAVFSAIDGLTVGTDAIEPALRKLAAMVADGGDELLDVMVGQDGGRLLQTYTAAERLAKLAMTTLNLANAVRVQRAQRAKLNAALAALSRQAPATLH